MVGTQQHRTELLMGRLRALIVRHQAPGAWLQARSENQSENENEPVDLGAASLSVSTSEPGAWSLGPGAHHHVEHATHRLHAKERIAAWI